MTNSLPVWTSHSLAVVSILPVAIIELWGLKLKQTYKIGKVKLSVPPVQIVALSVHYLPVILIFVKDINFFENFDIFQPLEIWDLI